jgi:hypothetical protein
MQFIPTSDIQNQAIYSIAYGSEFILHLNGGSNFWQSHGEY